MEIQARQNAIVNECASQCVERADNRPYLSTPLYWATEQERGAEAHLVGILARAVHQQGLKRNRQIECTVAMRWPTQRLIETSQC